MKRSKKFNEKAMKKKLFTQTECGAPVSYTVGSLQIECNENCVVDPIIHFLAFCFLFPSPHRCTLSSSQKERGIIQSSRMLSLRVRLSLQKKVPPRRLLSDAAHLLHINSA